jgi:hypothetical protein
VQFVVTLVAALVVGFVLDAAGMPLVVVLLAALVAGLAADAIVRRRLDR